MISLGEVGHLWTIGYGTQSPYTNNSSYTASGTSTVDNAKLSLATGTGTLIPEYFTILDPKNDSIDDDADGAIGTDTGNQSGDIDGVEIQVPGRININTALNGTVCIAWHQHKYLHRHMERNDGKYSYKQYYKRTSLQLYRDNNERKRHELFATDK